MASAAGLRLVSRPLSRLTVGTALAAGGVAFGGTWWFAQQVAVSSAETRIAQVKASVDSTADAAGSLLAAGDVSGARRLVASLGQGTLATTCRIEITSGRVLADMVASRITQQALPDVWPAGPAPTASWEVADGMVRAGMPVRLGDLRQGLLILEAPAEPGFGASDTLVHSAIVGIAVAVAGCSMVLVARRRMRDLLAVGEAAAAAAAGEPHEAGLRVDERYGPLAAAWNTLVVRLAGRDSEQAGHEGVHGEAVAEQDGRGVCDTLWHGVLVIDAAGRVRYLNGAAALLLSVRREAAMGSDAAELLGHPETIEAVRRAAAGDSSVRASFERAPADGSDEGVLRLSVRPLRSPAGGESAFVLVEDVTQQRLADRSRNAFVAQATHELRTPLTNVRLYVEELLEGGGEDPETRGRCLEVISNESRRLERMVGDMLSIAEIEAGTMRLHADDLRLEPMLQSLERDFKAMAKDKSIKLEFKLPPKFPTLLADRDKVAMTLANLIGNAFKYTLEGGTVTVAVKTTPTDVRFEVTDSGIGIKEDEHELVFRSFYRSKDRRVEGIAGSGLGLPIARQIARLHGGDILLTSAVDRGSTFTLVLPLRTPVSLAA